MAETPIRHGQDTGDGKDTKLGPVSIPRIRAALA